MAAKRLSYMGTFLLWHQILIPGPSLPNQMFTQQLERELVTANESLVHKSLYVGAR